MSDASLILAGAVLIAAVLLFRPSLKDSSRRPYIASPLMGQLLVGHAVGTIKKAIVIFLIGILALTLAVASRFNPDWFVSAKPIAGAHATLPLPKKIQHSSWGVFGTYNG